MTGTVKALDLANVIRDAFLAGAGMDTASKKIERIPDELLERLSSYNPEHVPAFGRLKSLHLSALTTAPATTGLVYRPNKYDDWGMIRNADGSLFAVVRRPLSEEEAAQHRENKTDPFESLARTLMSALTASASEPQTGRWSYSINYGPDGEENWANLITPQGDHVANIRTHHAQAIVADLNASPVPANGQVPVSTERTYYTEGKDCQFYEALSDKDFAWEATKMAQDLVDMDTLGLEEILPFVGVLSIAAARIERLASPVPASEPEPVARKELSYGQKLIAEAIEAHFGEREELDDDTSADTTNRDVWEAFDALANPVPTPEGLIYGEFTPITVGASTTITPDGAVEALIAWCEDERRANGDAAGNDFLIGEACALRRVVNKARELAALSHPADGWRDIDTLAPKTGDEFIARCGKDKPAFSCFWDGTAFVHYDHDDGLIAYPVTEWMPFPAPAAKPEGE